MLNILYGATFIKQLNNLPVDFVDDVVIKIEKLKDTKNHKSLKVHKLHGRLHGSYSFSASYDMRIVFEYTTKNTITLLAIGDHDVYKK